MRMFQGKIAENKESLLERLSIVRQQGLRIIQSNGCFDVLHVGHVYSLQFAKNLGGFHVVTLNSDASIRVLKGGNRPWIPERHRAEQLAALESVDLVYVFQETTAHAVVDLVRPDIYVKGIEYDFKGGVAERGVVERNGGIVILSDTEKPYSSTDLIEKLEKEGKLRI